MILFNDTALFMLGTSGKKIFDLPNADLMLIENFFNKEESDNYYNTFLHTISWREYEMTMYNKTVMAPRMVSWYEDTENPVSREGGSNWPSELLTIRQRVENETQIKFNAWHSDKTGNANKNRIITSVTFGETRMFRLRHKFIKDIPQVEIPLYHGSFLLMAGTTNSFWEHQVPKIARQVLPRTNLTFR